MHFKIWFIWIELLEQTFRFMEPTLEKVLTFDVLRTQGLFSLYYFTLNPAAKSFILKSHY